MVGGIAVGGGVGPGVHVHAGGGVRMGCGAAVEAGGGIALGAAGAGAVATPTTSTTASVRSTPIVTATVLTAVMKTHGRRVPPCGGRLTASYSRPDAEPQGGMRPSRGVGCVL